MRRIFIGLLFMGLFAEYAFSADLTSIDSDVAYAASKINPWKSAHCDDPVVDYPRWEGFPVTRCSYTDIGVTVRTYMLNPSKEQIAQWVVTACRDAEVTKLRPCVDHIVGLITTASSGGVFPIAGYIPEPDGGNICYVFRDGVTVWTQLRGYWLKPKSGKCGNSDDEEATQPVAKVWKFARIASTTRAEYKKQGGSYPVDDLLWMDAIREEYKKAWNSNRNELISTKAKAEKAVGRIK